MQKRILIVDDDPDATLYLSTILQDNGYITLTASDGQDGLRLAEEERPDLILLDLMMPRKSGLAMLSELQEKESLKNTPVIMVTGISSQTGVNPASFFKTNDKNNSGENASLPVGVLEKPVHPKKLLQLVEEAFR
jgi:CheY-like chemotaxis protein